MLKIGRLGRLTLQSNVGAGKSRARCTELSLDQRGESLYICSVDLNTLDGGNGSGTRQDGVPSLELGQDGVDELMGSDKDEEGSVLDNILEMGDATRLLGRRMSGKYREFW